VGEFWALFGVRRCQGVLPWMRFVSVGRGGAVLVVVVVVVVG